MSFKLDISKAYDRVKWAFLSAIMDRMGFASKWIDLIMECAQTISYSVLVNGHESRVITPSRDLRQGDPLSVYLFIICADVLSILLNRGSS